MRLESVLGATPHEFESRILRQMGSDLRCCGSDPFSFEAVTLTQTPLAKTLRQQVLV